MILRSIRRFLGRIILSANALMAVLMLFSAFSSHLNPHTFPMLSCAGLAFPIFLLLNVFFLIFWLFFKRKYALLPFFALFACVGQIRTYFPLNGPSKGVPDDAIKILSYNVMSFDSHKPHTEESPNEIVQYLQKCDADIICLQEATFNNADPRKFLSEKVFRSALDYPYIAHYKDKGNGWICMSRYPILTSRMMEYESAGNGTVVYELKVGADTLLLINNHLESNKLTLDDRAAYRDMIKTPEEEKMKNTSRKLLGKLADAIPIRATQADSVAKYVRNARHKYVVVCGDFNDSPLSYAHRVIGEGLNDAFIETGNGLGLSYNRNGFYFRIDHIMANDSFELFDCTVDDMIEASDHYPIWCYIRKK